VAVPKLIGLTELVFIVFQKSSPPPPKKFFGIFSLWLSLSVKFCKFVGNSYQHICTNFYMYFNISSNGVNFSTSTHRFHHQVLSIDTYMWIWTANKCAKFHAKRLNQSENIPHKVLGGGATFLKHPVDTWQPSYTNFSRQSDWSIMYMMLCCCLYCFHVFVLLSPLVLLTCHLRVQFSTHTLSCLAIRDQLN